jgi:hypothetical protein
MAWAFAWPESSPSAEFSQVGWSAGLRSLDRRKGGHNGVWGQNGVWSRGTTGSGGAQQSLEPL